MAEQTASQPSGGGSIPTPSLQKILFAPCTAKDIKSFVEQNHYSHSLGGANDFCFRADYDGQLVGAIAYGFMGGNPKGCLVLKKHDDPKSYRELRRLVFIDAAPRNSESRLIGYSLSWLKKNTDLLAIISFSDTAQKHTGTVYQATNWLYTGLNDGGHDRRIFIDGKEIHPRGAVAKYGTSSQDKLKEMGLDVEFKKRSFKHRYVYLLRPELRPLLKLPTYSYPKAGYF